MHVGALIAQSGATMIWREIAQVKNALPYISRYTFIVELVEHH